MIVPLADSLLLINGMPRSYSMENPNSTTTVGFLIRSLYSAGRRRQCRENVYLRRKMQGKVLATYSSNEPNQLSLEECILECEAHRYCECWHYDTATKVCELYSECTQATPEYNEDVVGFCSASVGKIRSQVTIGR